MIQHLMKYFFFLTLCFFFLIPSKNTLAAVIADTQSADSEPSKKTKVKVKKKKKKKKKGCRSYASPQYKKMKKRWQKVPKIPKPRYRAGYRDLTLYAVNIGKRIRVFPFLPDGTLCPDAHVKINYAFQDKNTGAIQEIDPRLIKLIYKLADHFKARQVNVISGFREEVSGSEGNHGRGMAVDINIPGVALGRVAKKARTLGKVGVGYYPASGFIHLDVREKRSYFWIDRSGPGLPSCHKRMLEKTAWKFDRKYKPKKDEPRLHKNKKGVLLGALPEPEPDPESPDEVVDEDESASAEPAAGSSISE